jgi:hypothetical protein
MKSRLKQTPVHCRLRQLTPRPRLTGIRGRMSNGGRVLISLRFAGRLRPRELIQGTKRMDEKRKYPRTEVNEPAYVSSGGSVMSCTVCNMSAEGAAIDVENPAFVPARFRLVMANDSSVRECSVVWIQRNRIGVSFS